MLYKREETIKAKEILGKDNNVRKIFHSMFSKTSSVGNLTNLFRLHNPSSEQEFCSRYFSYAENNKHLPIVERGMTYDEFLTAVDTYKKYGDENSNTSYNYEYYFNDLLCHLFTETFDGKRVEVEFNQYVRNKGYETFYCNGVLDSKYGLDILVKDKEGKYFGIQIKPITFFLSRKSDVFKDKMKLIRNYHTLLEDKNLKTYYAIYKNGNDIHWILNNDNILFTIESLFSYDLSNLKKSLLTHKLPTKYKKL